MTASLRCPFCHDELPADAPLRCADCDAPHHVECFLEQGGCAATACGGTRSRLGEQLELDALRALAADPQRLNALAAKSRRTSRPAVWSMVLLLATFGAVLGSLFGGALAELVSGRVQTSPWWPASIGALVGLVLAWRFMLRHSDLPSRRAVHRGTQEHFDPILGFWRYDKSLGNMFPPSNSLGPFEETLQQNAPPRAAVAVAPPERCPSCQGRLREPGEELEPLSFCFHCGSDLSEAPDPIQDGVHPEPDVGAEGEPGPRIALREVDAELPEADAELVQGEAPPGEDEERERPDAAAPSEDPSPAAPPTQRATE